MGVDSSELHTATIEGENRNPVPQPSKGCVAMMVHSLVFLARDGFRNGPAIFRVVTGFRPEEGPPLQIGVVALDIGLLR